MCLPTGLRAACSSRRTSARVKEYNMCRNHRSWANHSTSRRPSVTPPGRKIEVALRNGIRHALAQGQHKGKDHGHCQHKSPSSFSTFFLLNPLHSGSSERIFLHLNKTNNGLRTMARHPHGKSVTESVYILKLFQGFLLQLF